MADLTTLARFKEYAQIATANTTWDAVLATLITQCSKLVEKYCQRTLLTATHTDYYDGKAQREIVLRQFPVTSVTTVHDDSARSYGSSTLVAAADYYADLNRGIIKFDITLGRGRGNLKVVYVAGYADIGSLPGNVVLAVNKVVGAAFNKRKSDGQTGDSLGNTSFSYEPIITADVAALLEGEMNLSESA